jgi:hypothetical protein
VRHGIAASRYREQARRGISGIKTKPRLAKSMSAGIQEIKKALVLLHSKVYETDPLICPKCQGEMWFDKLTTLRKLEGRIISFIDQPGVIKKILKILVYGKSLTPLLKETLR